MTDNTDSNTKQQTQGDGQGPEWQQEVINRLVFASLNEQRKARRWGIFFKSLTFAYLFFILILLLLPGDGGFAPAVAGKHTALVDVRGIIAADAEASADRIISGLRAAFENRNSVGVIIRINSPGGSPVQAGYINDEMRRLREEYPDKPLYAVITDLGASGAYYIAVGAEKIYVDKASLVGSIGVISSSFGFVEAMKKLGIERRLYTAGRNKAFLDPFSPEKPEEVAHFQSVLNNTHAQFIRVVREGRGDRLKGKDEEIFSGLFWSGEQSVEMGLADGMGSSSYIARTIFGEEDIVDYTPPVSFFDQFAEKIGAGATRMLLQYTGALHLR
ncbi:MAG TPA: S49 family peptidase [Gammaproteobacteria bacterium]|nr:S49 family peptidase [Gammaproteobacteria bacterium]